MAIEVTEKSCQSHDVLGVMGKAVYIYIHIYIYMRARACLIIISGSMWWIY
jgi:hypothetical protein